jgi:hypothetical protein
MDPINYYEHIKKLRNGTLLELAFEIEKLYNTMSNDEKNTFIIYLEFEYLANFKNEIESNNVTIETYRFLAKYDGMVEELNKSKQHYQFLTSWVKQKKEVPSSSETEAMDLSNTKAIDKILYLHKLGIIDFLRKQQPFNTSVNSLATILSAITGEKSVTLQPMLNPMLSKKVVDKNNPLNSTKTVEKVENLLINIGFNLNKTI